MGYGGSKGRRVAGGGCGGGCGASSSGVYTRGRSRYEEMREDEGEREAGEG